MLRKIFDQTSVKMHTRKYQVLNEVRIYKENIIHNLNVFKSLNPDCYISAVLKSNAYGHGLRQIAEILNDSQCEFIDIDGYFEAHKIMNLTKHKILVMGYILPGNIKLLDNKKCSYVIQDQDSLKALGEDGRNFKVHVEINTGMNRLGINPNEIKSYLETLSKYKNLELEGVMSHLADADNPDDSYTDMQIKVFDKAVAQIHKIGFNPKYIHIAQSAGSAKTKSKYANVLRVGIGLYGINPLEKTDNNYSKLTDLRPAMEIQSTIIKVLDLKPGERVSYNGIYKADSERKIAALPLGYYEWVPRELSDKGFFTFNQTKLPIRGRVCMNHTMIDISGTKLSVGDKVCVVSKDNKLNSIQNYSDKYGLFAYHLLTRTNESIRRTIV